jgi:amidohydrolase
MSGGGLQEQLFEWFQWFHRHPEPSGAEHETTVRIREILRRTGITVIDTPLRTGLVAHIDGRTEGPVVALRCDIDALPIEENSGLSYSSDHRKMPGTCTPAATIFILPPCSARRRCLTGDGTH